MMFLKWSSVRWYELFSQFRRSKTLAADDTLLVKYAQKPQLESGSFCLDRDLQNTYKMRWRSTIHLQKWYPYHSVFILTAITLLLASLPLVEPRTSFRRALPGSGGLDRAVTRPHQITHHTTSQEAACLTDPGDGADLPQHDQKRF